MLTKEQINLLLHFNPDCMSVTDLKICRKAFQDFPEEAAKFMFPCESGGASTITTLLWYVKYKLYAMEARLEGNVIAAISEEESADAAYNELPPYAKW